MEEHNPRHPFALPNLSSALGMKAGDHVRYKIDGRTGIADEFLHDGDTFIVWDDGTCDTVKWNHLEPILSGEDNATGSNKEA
jgi:hypothetical protein